MTQYRNNSVNALTFIAQMRHGLENMLWCCRWLTLLLFVRHDMSVMTPFYCRHFDMNFCWEHWIQYTFDFNVKNPHKSNLSEDLFYWAKQQPQQQQQWKKISDRLTLVIIKCYKHNSFQIPYNLAFYTTWPYTRVPAADYYYMRAIMHWPRIDMCVIL